MTTVVVRYRTKPEMADQNQTLVQNVFEELGRTQPEGFRYVTLRLADGVTFLHIASVETADGSNPLTRTQAFQEFTRDIGERCDEPPQSQEVTIVGSYGLF